MNSDKISNMFEKNIKIKALEVTQGLCMLYTDGKHNLKNAEHTIDLIYKSVHSSLGNCVDPHEDWIEGLNQIHKDFRGKYINDE